MSQPAPSTAQLFATVQGMFSGQFELEQTIASSDIRALFLARDVYLDRQIALRIHFGTGTQRKWFERETQLLASLDHPSIRAVHSAGEIGEWAYRTSKFIEGESLADSVARGPRSIPDVLRLARDLMRVLEYAHSNHIVLRRIVPNNVMLERGGQAIITDLRYANRCLAFADDDPEGEQFLAPETWHGHAGEPASDIYATAAILYYALTAQPPANNPTAIVPPSQHRTACPRALERVIMRSLKADPTDRYYTAAEMAEDLFSELGEFESPSATPVDTRPSGDYQAWEKLLRRALGDEYELLDELGTGGFGSVYRVRDLRLEREAALKVLHPQLTVDPAVVERFRTESQLAAKLNHPHIVSVFDTRSRAGLIWYTMEYVSGMSLLNRITTSGPLGRREFLRMMQEGLAALQHAHQGGVVHRDLKPENILLENPDGAVRITDFGLAIALQADGRERLASHSGTPDYASPEQLLGEPVDHRSDLYSLTAVAYFALTGKPPFGRGSPDLIVARQDAGLVPNIGDARTDLPDAVFRVLGKGLSRAPEQRYTTASEFAAALDRAGRRGTFRRVRNLFRR